MDEEVKNCMVERDEAKWVANKSWLHIWLADLMYIEKLCDLTTIAKEMYYEAKINDKELWKTLLEYFKWNDGPKGQIQLRHSLIRMAYSSQDYLMLANIRQEMQTTNSEPFYS
jgi:hypothetical protein